MRLRADLTVGHPAAGVWAAMCSATGAACVDGLDPEAGTFTLALESGPLVVAGTADVASDERARTVTVDARGVTVPGGVRVRATLMARVLEDGLFCTVDVEAEVSPSAGPSGEGRLVAEALYRLADRFAECLERSLGTGPPAVPAVPAESMPGAAEAGFEAGWFRRLIGRLGGA